MKRTKTSLMSAVFLTLVLSFTLVCNVSFAGTFPGGYCTYGVQQIKGSIPWSGNAASWYYNAKSKGYSVGSQPKKGAIVVFPGPSSAGHVGVITNSDTKKPVMKSMNVAGLWKWTTGPISEFPNKKKPIKPTGYIYYKLDKY